LGDRLFAHRRLRPASWLRLQMEWKLITKRAFTLMELLVVIAIIGILAALLVPTISAAKTKAYRTACANNLRQINFGLRMYSDDSTDRAPRTPGTASSPGLNWSGYKNLMKSYVGISAASSPRDAVFACPADIFHYDLMGNFAYVPKGMHEEAPDYMSYGFNGGNARTNSNAPGIAGRTLSSIVHPAKTVLVAESAAFIPYSWHAPQRPAPNGAPMFNDAKDIVSFVDGHVSYIKIHWGGNQPPGSLALHEDPPPGYDYQWTGE
jgi:prepilin-type N-terminal cleavage/methylation domain-containing protein